MGVEFWPKKAEGPYYWIFLQNKEIIATGRNFDGNNSCIKDFLSRTHLTEKLNDDNVHSVQFFENDYCYLNEEELFWIKLYTAYITSATD